MRYDYFREPVIYKVSQITSKIKELLETDPELIDVVVEGEVSNWKIRGDHAYFVLKDEEAVLNCVMFGAVHRARNIEDGFHVLAYGRIGVYEKRGQYQLYCEQIQVVSKVGLLYQRYEELKNKLRKEGIFDKPKKVIPVFPKRIGVITSRDSAAYRDIYKVISKRYPLVEIYLFHTSVQGKEALVEIPKALKIADKYSLDLLILARGGGSIEDLWAFNEEVVVKSAFNLKTPLITGVGHEIDTTLVDFVADLRAPTPTGAASAAVPDIEELRHRLDLLLKNILSKLIAKLRMLDDLIKKDYRILVRNSPEQILLKKSEELEKNFKDLLKAFEKKLENLSHETLRYSEILKRVGLHNRIELYSENLKNRIKQLFRLENSVLIDSERRLESTLKNLKALKPTKPLERGFAIVRKSGKIVNASKLSEGDNVTIEFIDGKAKSTIEKVITRNDTPQNDQV
ncbi:MAG: exodeoxyribonuclease large subunit [Thermotogaceae bacterium]|jgi:exodeoxyribonuclease VII large subunit|nr:exodeoxyribonuclease large subunit [Thermotogaceae bacterium]